MEDHPTSEVEMDQPTGVQKRDENNSQVLFFSAGMEAAFLKLAEKISRPASSPTPVSFLKFDPEEPDADIEGWCKLAELVIQSKGVSGVDLILALTKALQGRAATCLMKANHDDLTWSTIKELLLSTFSKPMTMQDHFDKVIKFQLGKDESAAQGGLRLWQLIEKIPEAQMPETVITGFTISILSHCNDAIRRELNSAVVYDKPQLFRVLRGMTLKRKLDEHDDSPIDSKKSRSSLQFRGNCHLCGKIGHRGSECRSKNRPPFAKPIYPNTSAYSKQELQGSSLTCYVCGQTGHIASICPKRVEKDQLKKSTSIKEVNLCSKIARGSLEVEDSCLVCKASKGPSGAQQVQLHPIPKVAVPWHTIHIDISGKLSGKSEKREYCSVLIDSFTKFVILHYTPSLNAANAVKTIQSTVNLFGAPKRIIADKGRCYDNCDFKNFCKDNNIELHLIATGSSRANGQVERVMRTLKSMLTIIETSSDNVWRDQLGEIQLALNSSRCRVTGFTPLELMFGIHGHSLGISKISPSSQTKRIDLETARSNASTNIKKQAEIDVTRFNRGKASVKPFAIGDFVFVKCEERHQTKLDKKFKGPFKVISVLDNDRYELKHINGSNRLFKYAHENLRKVPSGQSQLLEIAESYTDSDESVSADENIRTLIQEGSSSSAIIPVDHFNIPTDDLACQDIPLFHGTRFLTTAVIHDPPNSDTLSIESEETLSAGSETMTADSVVDDS